MEPTDTPNDDSIWLTTRRSAIDGEWRHRTANDEPPVEVMRRRAAARRAIEDRQIERDLGLRD